MWMRSALCCRMAWHQSRSRARPVPSHPPLLNPQARKRSTALQGLLTSFQNLYLNLINLCNWQPPGMKNQSK